MNISAFDIYSIDVLSSLHPSLSFLIVVCGFLLFAGFIARLVNGYWSFLPTSLLLAFTLLVCLKAVLPSAQGAAAMLMLPVLADREHALQIQTNPDLARLEALAQIWLEKQHEKALERK